MDCPNRGSIHTLAEGYPNRIARVAIKRGERLWIGGVKQRHHHIVPTVFEETGVRARLDEQGFMDSEGRFLNRWQAARVAYRAGQIQKLWLERELYSEDVW